jgi:uncharacterized protein YciI
MKYYAVIRERGPAWVASLTMREQKRWDDHAAFMDRLAVERIVVLGGPLGQGERTFLLIFRQESEKAIEKILDEDPWTRMGVLRLVKIDPWQILLGKPEL